MKKCICKQNYVNKASAFERVRLEDCGDCSKKKDNIDYSSYTKGLLVFIYFFIIGFSYLLMLIVMTTNAGLFICAVGGLGIGFAIGL